MTRREQMICGLLEGGVEMTVIEFAEKRLNESFLNDDDEAVLYWRAYLDGARAQKKECCNGMDNERKMIMEEVKNYPPYLDHAKPYKAKTNAESIRALSDEDLANFLIGFSWLAENGVKMCYKTITKWLQQPAQEE